MKNAIDYNMKISLFKLSFMHLTILINCNMWRLEGDANVAYSLMFCDAVTLRCLSLLYGDSLFLFCGNSNAGKTTIVNLIFNTYPNAKVISDDHITIKKSRDGGYMRNSQNIDADTITCMSDKIHKLCI